MRKPPAPKATSAKKVKKRNPWSDDESKSDSDLEENEPVIPRETKSQRASGTAELNTSFTPAAGNDSSESVELLLLPSVNWTELVFAELN